MYTALRMCRRCPIVATPTLLSVSASIMQRMSPEILCSVGRAVRNGAQDGARRRATLYLCLILGISKRLEPGGDGVLVPLDDAAFEGVVHDGRRR